MQLTGSKYNLRFMPSWHEVSESEPHTTKYYTYLFLLPWSEEISMTDLKRTRFLKSSRTFITLSRAIAVHGVIPLTPHAPQRRRNDQYGRDA